VYMGDIQNHDISGAVNDPFQTRSADQRCEQRAEAKREGEDKWFIGFE
jgi:hypothetical protein